MLKENLHVFLYGIAGIGKSELAKAYTHFKRAFNIYEKIWADEPEMIETKYQEIQELYPQVGSFLGQQLSNDP